MIPINLIYTVAILIGTLTRFNRCSSLIPGIHTVRSPPWATPFKSSSPPQTPEANPDTSAAPEVIQYKTNTVCNSIQYDKYNITSYKE